MTYPDHYLLSWGGTFASDADEVWANNIRFARSDSLDGFGSWGDTPSNYTAMLDRFATTITTHMANTNSGYSANSVMKWVKFNRIDGQGHYASGSQSHTKFISGTAAAGSGGSPFPLATALVITFLTATERGPASKGRVFVPQPPVALNGTTYRVAAATCTAIATQWKAFLESLNDFPGLDAPGTPIASVVSNLGSGHAHNITQAQVGDVLDYMGSRRNRLRETRFTSAGTIAT